MIIIKMINDRNNEWNKCSLKGSNIENKFLNCVSIKEKKRKKNSAILLRYSHNTLIYQTFINKLCRINFFQNILISIKLPKNNYYKYINNNNKATMIDCVIKKAGAVANYLYKSKKPIKSKYVRTNYIFLKNVSIYLIKIVFYNLM